MTTEESEREQSIGERQAWNKILFLAHRNLGYDSPEAISSWIIEREQAVATLRGLCREFGDNDWPDKLSLNDILQKHLGDHLRK